MDNTLIKAGINDLQLELWLRHRNNNSIVWTTKQGENIPINQMTDEHLINTINLMEKIKEYKMFQLEHEGEIETVF
jgi:hypothetical protein